MKTCLSEGKLMEQFGNPPPPLFLSNFFITPLFVQISKQRNPPNFRGEETMCRHYQSVSLTIIRNPALCLSIYLTGIHFRGELHHGGDTSVSKKSSVNQSELKK